jgi:membrane-associated phospholipid phosphatase
MRLIAKIISILFHPLFIPTYGILLLYTTTRFHLVPILPKFVVATTIFCCTAIIPALIIFLFMKLGKVTSLNMDKRQERTRPYIYSIASYLICAYYVWRVNMPFWFVMMILGAAGAILSLMLVNLRWKMSAHLSAMGGLLAGILVVSFHYILNPYGLVIGVLFATAAVGSSRVILNAHTPEQTLVGFFNGFLFVLLAGLWF